MAALPHQFRRLQSGFRVQDSGQSLSAPLLDVCDAAPKCGAHTHCFHACDLGRRPGHAVLWQCWHAVHIELRTFPLCCCGFMYWEYHSDVSVGCINLVVCTCNKAGVLCCNKQASICCSHLVVCCTTEGICLAVANALGKPKVCHLDVALQSENKSTLQVSAPTAAKVQGKECVAGGSTHSNSNFSTWQQREQRTMTQQAGRKELCLTQVPVPYQSAVTSTLRHASFLLQIASLCVCLHTDSHAHVFQAQTWHVADCQVWQICHECSTSIPGFAEPRLTLASISRCSSLRSL